MKIQFSRFDPEKEEQKKFEFSKKFVAILAILWVAAACFGGYLVFLDHSYLPSLFDFIGAPMVGGVIGYMAKTAFENREKIRRSNRENSKNNEESDSPSRGNEE